MGTYMKLWSLLLGGALLLGVGTTANAGPIAELTLDSQPGSFIGAGQSFDVTYTPLNSSSFVASVVDSIAGSPSSISFEMGTITSSLATNTFATLEFSTAQLGVPITVGTYNDAERPAFATSGHPGLDVAFQNRGSNVITGSFDVTDAEFVGTTIEAFSATFTQDSDNNTSMISGTFTYFANVPEPTSIAIFSAGLAALGMMRRKRKAR